MALGPLGRFFLQRPSLSITWFAALCGSVSCCWADFFAPFPGPGIQYPDSFGRAAPECAFTLDRMESGGVAGLFSSAPPLAQRREKDWWNKEAAEFER
ncbi:uncharacterized protein [Zea mays]|uniref:uncharacterized protein n=1 Tax=Zea mays TaxID=4577 RepID=UPI0009AAB6E6|nr:uncharacterized protein LOC109941626 [Zea mays]|eukprot:XP_020398362.1 uncharacterized protein LOC109941626 [Zea mays]